MNSHNVKQVASTKVYQSPDVASFTKAS